MSLEVRALDYLVVGYIRVLEGSWGARKVLENGGVDVMGEISSAKEVRKELLKMLAEGRAVV